MPYASPISDSFQAKFNQLAIQKKFSAQSNKKDVQAFALKFFRFMLVKGALNYEHCPFPEYLAENFIKKVNS